MTVELRGGPCDGRHMPAPPSGRLTVCVPDREVYYFLAFGQTHRTHYRPRLHLYEGAGGRLTYRGPRDPAES